MTFFIIFHLWAVAVTSTLQNYKSQIHRGDNLYRLKSTESTARLPFIPPPFPSFPSFPPLRESRGVAKTTVTGVVRFCGTLPRMLDWIIVDPKTETLESRTSDLWYSWDISVTVGRRTCMNMHEKPPVPSNGSEASHHWHYPQSISHRQPQLVKMRKA